MKKTIKLKLNEDLITFFKQRIDDSEPTEILLEKMLELLKCILEETANSH